jgi:hypothetical protein
MIATLKLEPEFVEKSTLFLTSQVSEDSEAWVFFGSFAPQRPVVQLLCANTAHNTRRGSIMRHVFGANKK